MPGVEVGELGETVLDGGGAVLGELLVVGVVGDVVGVPHDVKAPAVRVLSGFCFVSSLPMTSRSIPSPAASSRPMTRTATKPAWGTKAVTVSTSVAPNAT